MRNLKVIFLALLFSGIGAIALIDEVGIDWYPPVAHLPGGAISTFAPPGVRSCMSARVRSSIGDGPSARHWHHCQTVLAQTDALGAFGWRYWGLVISCTVTLLSAFGFALAIRLGRERSRVLRGRRLLTGDHARRSFLRSAAAEARMSGAGLELLPGLAVSRERETRHWLIWGSVGAGKTQTMLHLILAAIARGDGVLVLDVKGDMTAGLPGEPLLIAPQDRRSLVWDVARDCQTKQDERELAARLIPKSNDPMWSDAARDILVVCVAGLQATRGQNWSWSDLHTIATSDADTLLGLAKAHHVDAVRLLESPDSRTTQSVLSTFQAHMHVAATLADAWRDNPNGGFAISNRRSPAGFILDRPSTVLRFRKPWAIIGGFAVAARSTVGLDLVLDAGDQAVGFGLAKDLGRDGALPQNGERVLVGGHELTVAWCTGDEVGLELVRRVPGSSQVTHSLARLTLDAVRVGRIKRECLVAVPDAVLPGVLELQLVHCVADDLLGEAGSDLGSVELLTNRSPDIGVGPPMLLLLVVAADESPIEMIDLLLGVCGEARAERRPLQGAVIGWQHRAGQRHRIRIRPEQVVFFVGIACGLEGMLDRRHRYAECTRVQIREQCREPPVGMAEPDTEEAVLRTENYDADIDELGGGHVVDVAKDGVTRRGSVDGMPALGWIGSAVLGDKRHWRQLLDRREWP